MSFLKRLRTKRSKHKPDVFEDGPPAAHDATTTLLPISDFAETKRIIACTTNAAFQEAWDTHWESLDLREKAAWSHVDNMGPLNVRTIVQDWDRGHKQQSFSRRIADKTLKFLRSIETLMAGAAIGIQSYPEVSAIVIGVVRVIINIAVKYFEYYEKLSNMLERLSAELEVYDRFAKRSKDEHLLHKTLVAIYGNILTFCRHARNAFLGLDNATRQSTLSMFAKVQWAPFEEQFGRIQSDLEHNRKNLETISTAIILHATKDIHEEMRKKLSLGSQNERRDFLKWISEGDCEEIHELVRQKRYGNTGSWLLSTQEFEEWGSDRSHNAFWCYGPPGVGKSVLASMVIDQLIERREESNATVAYAYFKGEDVDVQHYPVRLLAMLIKQLCWNLETLPDEVLKFYHKYVRNARKPSFDDLQKIFITCAGHLARNFVVLDGLDECPRQYRKPILQFISTIGQWANVKVFVTSRIEPDIVDAFPRTSALRLGVIPFLVHNDVAEFVAHAVQTEMSNIDAELQQEVIRTLTNKSDGMFLWVDLQLQDLIQSRKADIQRQLKFLPSGIKQTYLNIFLRMSKLPKTSRSLAQRCFLWTFYSKEPIEAGELGDAVSLENKIEYRQKANMLQYNLKDLQDVTCNLLLISEFSRVRPVHFSLQEFFMDSISADVPRECKDFFPNEEDANAQLALFCLQHLLLGDPGADYLRTIMLYCANHFDGHLRSLTTIPDEVEEMLDQLLRKEPKDLIKVLTWRWPISFHKYPDVDCPGNPQSMDVTFFLRLTKLDSVPRIRSRYDCADETRHYPSDYLHLACVAGLEDVVKDIIASQQDLDINRMDSDTLSALHYATQATLEGECPIIQILLDAGADPNLPYVGKKADGTDYETPLQMVILGPTNPEILKAFVNWKGFSLGSFVRTIKEDRPKFIEVLLDYGANINQADETGSTPLSVARSLGFSKIEEFLLESGAQNEYEDSTLCLEEKAD